MLSQYQEDHNDQKSVYEEMVSDHERISGHDPKTDMTFCETCRVIFNFKVEDGELCRFHPESYFEPATKLNKAFCEGCLVEGEE